VLAVVACRSVVALSPNCYNAPDAVQGQRSRKSHSHARRGRVELVFIALVAMDMVLKPGL
jgi:hypothetical protein